MLGKISWMNLTRNGSRIWFSNKLVENPFFMFYLMRYY
nr:MAG TPA: hypothetical protein [Caudoviricetes sp.]